MHTIKKALQQQIGRNKTKNMLYARLGQVIEVDPDFLAALEELLNGSGAFSESTLRDAISFAAGTLIKRLYAVNQFLQVGEQKRRQLEDIYLHTWQRIVETKNIQAALKNDHYPELTNWVASLYPQSFLKPLQDLPQVGRVVCGEYSPQLQIELLELDVQTLEQPVLDLGCGGAAGLPRYLRTLGLEAYGIDRLIEKDESYLRQTDWMDYRLELNTWGTIISNMAFTNHLHYANYHHPVQVEPYLRKFKEIIESLKTGGSFIYAPGVPFIEDRLEANRYRVENFEVIGEIHATKITKLIPIASAKGDFCQL